MKLTFLPSPLSCVAGGLKHVGVFFSVKRKKSFKRENVCWFAECYFTNAGINKKKKKRCSLCMKGLNLCFQMKKYQGTLLCVQYDDSCQQLVLMPCRNLVSVCTVRMDDSNTAGDITRTDNSLADVSIQ